jgi:hypothetical protein
MKKHNQFRTTSLNALTRAREQLSIYPKGNVLLMAYLFKTGNLPARK